MGLVEDFALTARFAEGFALERDVERLNPFVRLLLMCGISKRLLTVASSRGNGGSLPQASPLNQRAQVFAGALTGPNPPWFRHMCQQRKNLKVIVGYVKVRLACGGLIYLGEPPQPKK